MTERLTPCQPEWSDGGPHGKRNRKKLNEPWLHDSWVNVPTRSLEDKVVEGPCSLWPASPHSQSNTGSVRGYTLGSRGGDVILHKMAEAEGSRRPTHLTLPALCLLPSILGIPKEAPAAFLPCVCWGWLRKKNLSQRQAHCPLWFPHGTHEEATVLWDLHRHPHSPSCPSRDESWGWTLSAALYAGERQNKPAEDPALKGKSVCWGVKSQTQSDLKGKSQTI